MTWPSRILLVSAVALGSAAAAIAIWLNHTLDTAIHRINA